MKFVSIFILQLVQLTLSFAFGVLIYSKMLPTVYADWIILITCLNSIFVLTSYGNDIYLLKNNHKEELKTSMFSEVLAFKVVGASFLYLPIVIYLIFVLNGSKIILISFFIYILQRLYIDVLSLLYKLKGKIILAVLLTLLFDLSIRFVVLYLTDVKDLSVFFSILLVGNSLVLLIRPRLKFNRLKENLDLLVLYIRENSSLYINSFTSFLVFNFDILISPLVLSGEYLAGFLFAKSLILATKSIIDLVFEYKVIELSKLRQIYIKWSIKFIAVLIFVMILGLFSLEYILSDMKKYLSENVLLKFENLERYYIVIMTSILLLPVFRFINSTVLVFGVMRNVKYSNLSVILFVCLFSVVIYFVETPFIYFLPVSLFFYCLWNLFFSLRLFKP